MNEITVDDRISRAKEVHDLHEKFRRDFEELGNTNLLGCRVRCTVDDLATEWVLQLFKGKGFFREKWEDIMQVTVPWWKELDTVSQIRIRIKDKKYLALAKKAAHLLTNDYKVPKAEIIVASYWERTWADVF